MDQSERAVVAVRPAAVGHIRLLPAISGLPAQGESECVRDSPENSADLALLEPDSGL